MRRSKGLLSSIVAVAVVMLHSFSVYAVPNVSADALLPDQKGVLTSSGSVSINGNAVQSGATVLSGSTITTGAVDSIAIINIDGLARVTIGPSTTATLTYDSSSALIKTTCGDMRVAVKQGSASVKLKDGSSRTLSAGQDDYFDSNVEVTAPSGSDVVVNCGRDVVCPPAETVATSGSRRGLAFGSIGLLGLLLLGGAAAGVAVAVASSGSSGSRQPVSGFRP